MRYLMQKSDKPAYLQLYKQLRDDIINGIYPFNTKLPSKRLLAEETDVSIITIQHAYELLCEEGYAEAKERSGYYVIFKENDGFAIISDKTSNRIHQTKDTMQQAMSVSLLSKTMRKVLNDYQEAILEKSDNLGCLELREALKKYLARNRRMDVTVDQIVIGSGAEYLYRLIIDLLGRDKRYAFEHPSYEKIEQIFHGAGVLYERLPLTDDGIDSHALNNCFANVLQTTPYRSYPSDITASASKRHEYIRWAQKSNRFIIESDYGSEFAVSSKPMETLFVLSENDNVIYLNTFSRTISPSIRAAYMVLPSKLVADYQNKLGFYSCTVPTYEQFVLTELLNSGDFERHINRIRRAKRKKMATH